MANPRAFFDFVVNDAPAGRIVFEIFKDKVPKTAENFLALCRGVQDPKTGKLMTYKGNVSHRIINNFMLQAGDIVNGNGTGSWSIYGGKFNDEGVWLKHTTKGLLSMANSGPNTNGSQFFLTFIETPWLDGKHTVFGKVVQGDDVLTKLESYGTQSGKPKAQVKIADCGVLE